MEPMFKGLYSELELLMDQLFPSESLKRQRHLEKEVALEKQAIEKMIQEEVDKNDSKRTTA